MKRLGVFLLPPGWHLVRRSHLYTWVERGTVRLTCLAQEHNTLSLARARPGPLAPESTALTMGPLCLPL